MIRVLFLTTLLVIATASVRTLPAQDKPPAVQADATIEEAEYQRFDGDWRIVEVTVNGKPVPDATLRKIQGPGAIPIKKRLSREYGIRFELDLSKSPHEIVFYSIPPAKGQEKPQGRATYEWVEMGPNVLKSKVRISIVTTDKDLQSETTMSLFGVENGAFSVLLERVIPKPATEISPSSQVKSQSPEPGAINADASVEDDTAVAPTTNAEPSPEISQLRVLKLKHAQADVVENLFGQLFRENVVVKAEARTNSLLLRGPAKLLDDVQAIVIKIDQPSSAAGASSTRKPLLWTNAVPDPQWNRVVDAGTAPRASDLKERAAELERQAADLAHQGSTVPPQQAADLKGQLRKVVADAFAVRQKLHELDLSEFQRRMTSVQQTIQMREKVKDAIIDRRVADLLNPNLKWDSSTVPSTPKVTGRPYGMDMMASGSNATSSKNAGGNTGESGRPMGQPGALIITVPRAVMSELDGEWRREMKRFYPLIGVAEDPNNHLMMRIEGNSLVQTNEGEDSSYRMVINAQSNPKTIDLTGESRNGNPPYVTNGIYRLDGDYLTIAWGHSATARPKGFGEGDGVGKIVSWCRIGARDQVIQFKVTSAGGETFKNLDEAGSANPLPARLNLADDKTHSFELANNPEHPSSAYLVTIEVPRPAISSLAFLAHNSVPLNITNEDIVQVAAGRQVVKALYLPDREFQKLNSSEVDVLVSTRVDPRIEVAAEAERRGAVLAIVRMRKQLSEGSAGKQRQPSVLEPAPIAKTNAPTILKDIKAFQQQFIVLQRDYELRHKELEEAKAELAAGTASQAVVEARQIRANQARWRVESARAEYAAEIQLLEIDVRLAHSNRELSEMEWMQSQKSNSLVPGTVSATELRRLEFAKDSAALNLERAKTLLELSRKIAPAADKPKEATFQPTPEQEAATVANLKSLMQALHNYHDLHKRFPPAVIMGKDGKGKVPHSWRVEILPMLGKQELYDKYHFDEAWDSESNAALLKEIPAVFRSPLDLPESTNASYFALVTPGMTPTTKLPLAVLSSPAGGSDGKVFPPEPGYDLGTAFSSPLGARMIDMHDGTSNTIMLVEAERSIPWLKPEDIPYFADKPLPVLDGFPPGWHAGIADGTVKFLAADNEESVIRHLITIGDGHNVFPKLLDNKGQPLPTGDKR